VRTAKLAPEACVERASALLDEMEARRRALTGITPASRADTSWMSFRVEWLERLRPVRAQLRRRRSGPKEIAKLFRQLEHLEDLYTTSAVQYSGRSAPRWTASTGWWPRPARPLSTGLLLGEEQPDQTAVVRRRSRRGAPPGAVPSSSVSRR
jgi:hypothetical protein